MIDKVYHCPKSILTQERMICTHLTLKLVRKPPKHTVLSNYQVSYQHHPFLFSHHRLYWILIYHLLYWC